VVLASLAIWGPGAVRERGARQAHALAQQISPTLRGDPRFAKVGIMLMTHPSLCVSGEVPDEQALLDLKRLTQAPPDAVFQVFMTITVTSTELEKLRAAGSSATDLR
jgi:hypothetical protein